MDSSIWAGHCTSRDIRWEFEARNHSSGRGVHTFDIVKRPEADGYFGYAGPLISGGKVELWISEDLYEWEPHSNRVVFQRPGARWPTVLREGDSIYMIVRQSVSFIDKTLDRIYHISDKYGFRIPRGLFRYVGTSRFEIYESTDGVTFDRVGFLCNPSETGREVQKNPFLFEHPSGGVGFVYFSRVDGTYKIFYRCADEIDGLSASPDVELLSSDSLVAAPSVYFDDDTGIYSVLVEQKDPDRNVWLTTAYTTDDLQNGVNPDSRHVLFENNVACPFPYWNGDERLLFVSSCTTDLDRSVDETTWQGLVYNIENQE